MPPRTARMNHVYRTIWNHAKGVWQVVGEHTTSQGKTKSSKTASSAGLLALGAILSSPGVYAQGIVTDGRTATSLVQNGQVTDIRTNTIQGGNVSTRSLASMWAVAKQPTSMCPIQPTR